MSHSFGFMGAAVASFLIFIFLLIFPSQASLLALLMAVVFVVFANIEWKGCGNG